jgi:glycosyltransferase involved in cell wall biosynthesis
MNIKTAVCYSFSLGALEPMAYVRLSAPLQQAGIAIINGIENGQVVTDPIPSADMVIIQREFAKNVDDYQKVVALARENKKPIIFELDDLLFFLPKTHPDRQGVYYAPSLLPMFQALIEADFVTVSTRELHAALVDFNPNVAVLQNYFDDTLWQLRPPVRKDSAHEMLTIGYMGTNSHRPDLSAITPALLEIASRYLGRVRFRFWGVQPPAQLLALPQVEWVSEHFVSYPEFAAFFQTQSADIFIAPLADNFFNRCKSSLKFFEYSALGAAGIFSRLEPYETVVTHQENGLLAASLDEWRDGLVELIENDELRFQLAANAQASIRQNWLLSQNAFRWKDAFERAGDVAQHREQRIPLTHIVSSMNTQLFETFQALHTQAAARDEKIESLTIQLSQAEKENEQLKEEVLKYALSKSWRFTRPFRAIQRKLERF